jgi:ATP-dependent HslUV protease ATP-binding subunit HslU
VRNARATAPRARSFRKKLREGQLDDKEIEIDLAETAQAARDHGPAGMEEMTEQLRGMFSQIGGGKRKTRKLKIAEAMKLLVDEEAGKLVNEDEIKRQAIHNAEQNGIVFIDEIDKVTSRSEAGRRRGVAPGRAARPAAAGGGHHRVHQVRPGRTDHILFIASGAFHLSKPSDLIPELQGRLPIRVELQSLSVQDFEAILTQTHASLVKQYQALLATEGVRWSSRPTASRGWRTSPTT